MKKFLKFAAIGAAVVAGLALAGGTVVEFLIPKEQLRKACVAKMQEALGRQVKMAEVSIGPWKGVRMEAVAVSEKPNFEAGTFFEAQRLTVHPRLLPFLLGRATISQVALLEPKVRIVKEGAGRYNFSDILNGASRGAAPPAAPAGKKPAGTAGAEDAAAAPPAPMPTIGELLTTGWDDPMHKLRVVGQMGLEVAGSVAGMAAGMKVDVEIARVKRGELTFVDRENAYSFTLSNVSAWAQGLGARGHTEAKVDFKLQGSHQGQPMEAEATFEVRADMAQYYPTNSAGQVILTRIRHPNFKTERVRAEWDLKGLTPDLLQAQGIVRLEGSPGVILKPAFIARQGKWLGLLFYPVDVLAKFRGLGLQDMDSISYSELRGEYSFSSGSVNIAPLYVRGPDLSINAEGVVNLARQAVGLKANLILGESSVSVLVKGPIGSPMVEPDVSFKGVKRPRQTAEQMLRKGGLLDRPFSVNMPTEEDEPRGSALPGLPKRPRAKKAAPVGRQTIKDAEKIIDSSF